MMPANEGSIILKEMPERVGDGCQRTSFRAYFVVPGADDAEQRWVRYRVTRRPEVAWSPTIPCQFASYSGIMPPLEPVDGIKKLSELDAFRRGDRPFRCASEISETYCDDPERVRKNLASLSAWMILETSNGATLWLGMPGSVITWVNLPRDPNRQASVAQKRPAPF
ncbi:hypothetical protein GCM10010923_18250 [Blastomonas marina]|uniref:Uncharacterized protein n=2 Tax=Blastomonas marina TaxID=1867408 RepID=A0ABQ1FE74_9SPHN|nr:hypothetical protein GCM10010923_18250 [Blastomonas marina]